MPRRKSLPCVATKKESIKIVWLQISSWVGSSVWYAEHYYGRLISGSYADKNRTEEQVQKPMTASEARERNKENHRKGDSWKFKKGDMTGQFISEQDVVDAAVEMWKEKFPDGQVLIRGFAGTLD